MKLSAKNQETRDILQAAYEKELEKARDAMEILQAIYEKELEKARDELEIVAVKSSMQKAIECGKISQSDMDNLLRSWGVLEYDYSEL